VTSKSWKFLKFVQDNLSQILSKPARKGVLLDLLFVGREGLMGDVTVAGCLSRSDHGMAEFKIFGVMRKKRSAELLPWISREKTYSGSYVAVFPRNLLLRA